MAQSTEAACLLQSGSMYPQRLGLRTRSGLDIFAGVKQGGVSVYIGDAPIYHFDLDGRWQRAFLDGMHYLKGLDTKIRSMAREREGSEMVLRRVTLSYAEGADLDDSIRSVALELIGDLDSGHLEILPTPSKARAFPPECFRSFLERISAWDSAAWFAHRERYLSTFGPLPFLPPDCPNALVLQATLGHEGGRAFGRGRPAEHYVRSPEEFREHARAVSRLTGRRLAQLRGVFLGGADVLRLPIDDVLGYLHKIKQSFPIGFESSRVEQVGDWDEFATNLCPVQAFLDDFRPPMPDLEGWRSLRAANLGRVTLGIESGDPGIRATFGKDWEEDALLAAIEQLKAAEIRVGLVILVGAGGLARSDRHLDSTARLLARLPLEAGDLVTLVDVRSLDESSGEGLEPLSDEETNRQIDSLKERSAAARPSKGPKVVAYNPDKRWA
jgi:hypothetical protein